jgi:rubrerythrin
MKTVSDIISIAMMLETQAQDLYMRYADKSEEKQAREIFLTLAEEEKGHLKRLGKLLNEKV